MGYRNAGEILPTEIIELIQQFVEGKYIYIPKRSQNHLKFLPYSDREKGLTIIYTDAILNASIYSREQ